MTYKYCPFFSDEVIEMGEWLQNNYDKPLGKPCHMCSEENCHHYPI